MVWGAPFEFVMLNGMFSTILFLAAGNPLYLLVGVPLHGVMWGISRHDPRLGELLWLHMRLAGSSSITKRFWGVRSYTHLPAEAPS